LVHSELGGLSLIGCQDVLVSECEIYGNHRPPIIIYDYWDNGYWDPNDPEMIEWWKTCHHPNDRILIKNNTMFVGPTQWHKDKWHNNTPYKKPCVLINNEVNKDMPYRQWQIGIQNNVMVSPWPCIIRYRNMNESFATRVHGNMVWTKEAWKPPWVEIPYGDIAYDFDWLQKNCAKWYQDNIAMDPNFMKEPEYQFVDRNVTPHFNFGKDHQTSANLFSESAADLGKGKTYKKNLLMEENKINPFEDMLKEVSGEN